MLVLDDYHVIDAREVQEGMAFLLDHLPPRLHLVIASRADPALPLARLRARGELVEIRAADLRFTPEEAAAYLNEVMGLALTAQDVAALEGRTEGWIAALQLAALSMQGRDDAAGFIAGFAGDDRYVVDYLVEEVLQRQPERRAGLPAADLRPRPAERLRCATPSPARPAARPCWRRSTAATCSWSRSTTAAGGTATTTSSPTCCERACSTSSPTSSRPCTGAPATGTSRTASGPSPSSTPWPPRTSSERPTWSSWRPRRCSGSGRRARCGAGWRPSPRRSFRVRPVLSNAYVGSLMSTGEIEGVEPYLRNAERWLDAMSAEGRGPQDRPPDMVVVDEEAFRRLPTWVAVHRAGQALVLGDRAGCITHARRALDLAGPDDHVGRAAASALIGLASWGDGDVAAAQAGYAESWNHMQRAGHIADILGLAITLGDLQVVQGRLGDAMRTYEQALRLAAEQDGPVLRGTADMYVGMAALHRERDDLPAANELLLRSQELGEHLGLPQNPHRWRVAMARVREAEGDLDGAVDAARRRGAGVRR